MGLTAEEFRSVRIPTLKVDVPELGGDGHTFIRKLSLKGREDWERWQVAAQNADAPEGVDLARAIEKFGGWRGYLLARTLSDEDGVLLFADPDEGLEVLGACPADVMDRVYDQAIAFCGLSKEAEEELEGNLPSAPSVDSS